MIAAEQAKNNNKFRSHSLGWHYKYIQLYRITENNNWDIFFTTTVPRYIPPLIIKLEWVERRCKHDEIFDRLRSFLYGFFTVYTILRTHD